MPVTRVSLVMVTVLIAGATQGQRIDPRIVLSGWRSAIARASSVPYVMTGLRHIIKPFPAPPGSSFRDIKWKSIVDGRKYHVWWTSSPDESDQQSFDGSLWYGLNQQPAGEFGTIAADPKNSLKADLDANLAEHAAGSFFVRIQDTLERPLNMNGASLLDLAESSREHYTAEIRNGRATLKFAGTPPGGQPFLPRLEFALREGLYYPVLVVYQNGDELIQCQVSDYARLNGGFYPRKITETNSVRKAGEERPTGSAEWQISVTKAKPTNADFRIEFPKGTRLFDDRKPPGSQLYRVGASPAPGAFRVWTLVGQGIFALGFGMALIEGPRHD